ncbi:MAG: DegT/DnrJ/EryC1/StrS family aminotransferase [Desulfamplus sp.]|nr:DegT/DnrJ/EryC1/StrS family aminotransferase [Desulfamplus sp.]
MFKAYSRSRVDLSLSEQTAALLALTIPRRSLATDHLSEFEHVFAARIGVKEAISFPSCRSAMFFALKNLEFEPDAEVILPAFTFWVDAAMVILAGLTPVFVDVDFATMNMDPVAAGNAITPRTRAIFPTHLNGLSADLDPIKDLAEKYDLRLIEDCARSCMSIYKNSFVGTADIGTFSFGYGKSFFDFGGGMLTTNDTMLAERIRRDKLSFTMPKYKTMAVQTIKGILLRWLNTPFLYPLSLFPLAYSYQIKREKRFESLFKPQIHDYREIPESFCVNMNNQQARLGLSQLKRIEKTNAKRHGNLNYLNALLDGVGDLILPFTSPQRPNVGVHYAVWTEHKKDLQRHLFSHRIDAQDESAVNTAELEIFRHFSRSDFPNATKLNGNILFLPTHPQMSEGDLTYIADIVKEYFETK